MEFYGYFMVFLWYRYGPNENLTGMGLQLFTHYGCLHNSSIHNQAHFEL
jgi:hypothetical protein